MSPLRRRTWLLATCALFAVGCLNPTLPLPPPEAPEVSAIDDQGFVTLKGAGEPDAIVYGFNQRSGEGVITTASSFGTYVLKVRVQLNDEVAIWQEVGTDRSASILVVIRPK